eukprot:9807917-Heterocapsa_arctica.AAC.1
MAEVCLLTAQEEHHVDAPQGAVCPQPVQHVHSQESRAHPPLPPQKVPVGDLGAAEQALYGDG